MEIPWMSGMRATSVPKVDMNQKKSSLFDNREDFSYIIIHFVSNFEEIRIYFRQGAPQGGLSCPCGAIRLLRLPKIL